MGQRVTQILDFSYTSMCVWNGRLVNNFISTCNIAVTEAHFIYDLI